MANSEVFQFKHANRFTNGEVLRAIDNGHVRGVLAYRGVWTCRVAIGDFTASAATSQEIDLHDDITNYNLFPANVWLLPGHSIVPITAFAGGAVSAATGEVGDTDDPNGLVTASNIFTGVTTDVPVATPAAAQYALRFEAAYIPTLTLRTTDADVDALTAGELEVRIRYMKFVDV